ncbi:putative cyclase [Variovorax beijingensis]|uniref:Kynurenine formamidase n=2 Tax=Variovorax TaxID=34072 RepID=A0AAE4C0U5_VARPD|nr:MULTISPECIES: cyclase family protein [Variovorax]MBD9665275.1 cyclase family protein [Variovorax sp. VRV01]MDR6429542.1 kynurenine formamidase [Variovorax paradoxus]MDR6455598.1 kynurenine formamidase [Variovorax paradoxus]TWD76887.1 putative cyclase [Variovorax beijingensis]
MSAPADNPRWRHRPEGANWGDFGSDDQIGRMNLVTPGKVLEGVREVREGRVFSLSLPLDIPGGTALNPNRLPPVLRPTLRQGRVNFNCLLNPGRPDVLSDDLAILHLQYSTQWDSLAHAGTRFDADGDGLPETRYYNGYTAADMCAPASVEGCGIGPEGSPFASTSRAQALGIERLARTGVQGVAVMIDLQAHFGSGRTLVGYDALRRVLDADGIEVRTGDLLCIHTGYAEALLEMRGQPDTGVLARTGAALDGHDERLLQWITDCGVAAVAADNLAVEEYPARAGDSCCSVLPLHQHCLVKLGIHLGELWRLTPLARWLRANGRHRFLLTAPPLDLPGAVGSPVTPVATV